MQTKTQSFIETIINTAIGFVISLLSTFIIFPLVGIEVKPVVNLEVTLYFTIISILRGYIIRRFFNKTKLAQGIKQDYWLHCFECEIKMPVNKIDDNLYCANCGLIHLNHY